MVGLASLAALTMHGALWVGMKTTDPIAGRAHRIASRVWWAVLALTALITWFTMRLQPQVSANLAHWPAGMAFPLLALLGLIGVPWFLARRNDGRAFLASAAYLVGMLASAAFGLYPYVLPASTGIERGLTDQRRRASRGFGSGAVWWSIGMTLAVIYVVVYRHFAGQVAVGAGATARATEAREESS